MFPFRPQPISAGLLATGPWYRAKEDAAGRVVAESPPQYCPRHPERTAFYQLFETHFDSYVRAYEERFEPQSGPLRPVVVRSVDDFLSCGRLEGGFARIRCTKCHKEHLLAFSCRTRNFCSGCQAKRSVLFAEKLTNEILAPVPHRHWTFSIPRVLRGLFERERSLLSLLSQTAYASILKSFQALLGRKDVRPGCVLSLQTYGAYGANFNPHCHGLVTDGAFSADGEFLPLPSLDASAVMEVFRRLLLLRLHRAERLSESFMNNLLSWVHPGFSVYAGPPVDAAETASMESQARYITRPVLAMEALHRLDNGSLVLETPPDPKTGATSIELDPLEWIHRITSHIPDPGRHCQRFYGAYSNRGRIRVAPAGDENVSVPVAKLPERDNSDYSRETRSTWARLIRKIFEADPLLCPCGGRMRIVSFITDPRVVDRILKHRGSGHCKTPDPFEPRPPPRVSAKILQ
ncbi:MAG: transposase [Acidobacteria bacterium]|nr:transposase [Acidobacteriota bacterium]